MKKKFLPAALAAALLLFLSACTPSGAEGTPSAEVTPKPTPSETVTPTPEVTPEPTPAADEGARYFFYRGQFLGAWSEDGWRSAETEDFTTGELFNRTYYDYWGEPLGAARFYAGEGIGEFDLPSAPSLLEPFGVIEGDDFIMKLPGQLTGEAAQITVPDYSFYVAFDGQNHLLVSNVTLTRPEMSLTTLDLSPEEVTAALESVGIRYKDPTRADSTAWLCDMDGDGEQEYLELIRTPQDESYYSILEPGDPCFYAFLLRDGEEISVMASRFFPYTDDVTAHFTAGEVELYDLDGDGICELLFCDGGWEWGSYHAYSLVDGEWTNVLCGQYGT